MDRPPGASKLRSLLMATQRAQDSVRQHSVSQLTFQDDPLDEVSAAAMLDHRAIRRMADNIS